jgi:hypothetical protein
MKATASWKRDWHQFRLLSRDAVRQLIDTALFSRESDPAEYAIWMLALVATPVLVFAVRQMLAYTALQNAPPDVVFEVVLAHRLFFITYGMLAAALIASLAWEALFPDGRDQEIIGVLPVRPHTFAAARLGAAVTVGGVFTAAVNLPAGIIYTAFAAGHPANRGHLLGLLAGHILATMLGSMLVFFTLLVVRGVTAVVCGARAGAWLGALLQLITVVLMVEVFFFLPKVLGTLITGVVRGDTAALLFPPVWFAALHAWLAGAANQMLEAAMLRGLAVFAISASLVIPIYLLPARWLGRRALEKRSRERAAATTFLVRTIGTITHSAPAVRAIVLFTVVSLVRSRRHLTILASYFGIAVAISIASILTIEVRGTFVVDRPFEGVLALPMVFVFFGIMGLRASFRIPTEVEANWSFRMAQPSLATCVNASMLVMFTMIVLPIAVITFAALAPRWPFGSVVVSVALQVVSGIVLIDCLLVGWSKVPFACGHAPSSDALKSWLGLYAIAMYVFAFKLSDWQIAATTSTQALAWYVGGAAVVVTGVRILRYRKLRSQVIEFDVVPPQTMQELNLSGARN